jgi:cell division protein FtsA
MTSRFKRRRDTGHLIAALDIGSSKICCLIAQPNPARMGDEPALRVIGMGHQVSDGVRMGAIVDMDAVQRSITAAIASAEQLAGETIDRVFVNVSGGQPVSQTLGIDVTIGGREITAHDMTRAMTQTDLFQIPDGNDLIHAIPVGFSIDGNRGIRDPRGMIGQTLGVQLHLISAGYSPVRTLETALARCHLDIESRVVSPYASGLACLVEDEMDLGATLIDMGGGTTSLAVFFDGNVVYTDSTALGGMHVTNDIARGLTTTLAHAERIKTLYGSAIPSSTDDRETIDVPQIGEEDPAHATQVPKSILTGIIQPRLEETFELIRSRLDVSGFGKIAGRRVVLTGGASQLPGVRELAQIILDKQVRLGRPLRVAGLGDAASGPAFATAAGLLAYATDPNIAAGNADDGDHRGGLFGKVGGWLKQNF